MQFYCLKNESRMAEMANEKIAENKNSSKKANIMSFASTHRLQSHYSIVRQRSGVRLTSIFLHRQIIDSIQHSVLLQENP